MAISKCTAQAIPLPVSNAARQEPQASYKGLHITLALRKTAQFFFPKWRGGKPIRSYTKADAIYVAERELVLAKIAGAEYCSPTLSLSYSGYSNSLASRLRIRVPRKIGRLLRRSRAKPAMRDCERALCSHFKMIAAEAMHDAREQKLRKSRWILGPETSAPGQLHEKFDAIYACHFSERVDSLRSKYLKEKKKWSMSALLWEAHRLAFSHAIEQASSRCYASMMQASADNIDKRMVKKMAILPKGLPIDPVVRKAPNPHRGLYMPEPPRHRQTGPSAASRETPATQPKPDLDKHSRQIVALLEQEPAMKAARRLHDPNGHARAGFYLSRTFRAM